jgi:mRNA-degrading endonuclease RelE of RelBE toxin-antitoxin system
MGVKEEDASMQENITRPLERGTVITYRLRRNNKPGKGRVKQAGYYVILVTDDDGNEQIVFYNELLSVEPKEVAIDEQHY